MESTIEELYYGKIFENISERAVWDDESSK